MRGYWARALRIVSCVCRDCVVSIPRGELVYLLCGVDRQTCCPACAKKRFGYETPTNIPELSGVPYPPSGRRDLGISDSREPSSEGWIQATGARLGNEAKRRILIRRQQAANATDVRLRQLGGDQ